MAQPSEVPNKAVTLGNWLRYRLGLIRTSPRERDIGTLTIMSVRDRTVRIIPADEDFFDVWK